jgi:hypothetical protein
MSNTLGELGEVIVFIVKAASILFYVVCFLILFLTGLLIYVFC